MESFINVKSVEKISLKQGPWDVTKVLLMRVCSSVVTFVHTKQEEEVSWLMKLVISVTKYFTESSYADSYRGKATCVLLLPKEIWAKSAKDAP